MAYRSVPNMKMLRYARGFTQQELADAAGISRDAYVKIEAGRSDPRMSTLQRIAGVLGVEAKDLLPQIAMPTQVRFRSSRQMNARDMVLFDVMKWGEGYSYLEDVLNQHTHWALHTLPDEITIPNSGSERAVEYASQARRTLGLSDDEPIRDICGLFESAGIKVYRKAIMSEHFFGLSMGPDCGGPLVVVNVWDRISVERWIFTAAHELGHLLLHPASYDITQVAEDDSEEQEANLFASHFLMPQPVFEREWRDTRGLSFLERVLKVKRMFKVSYRTVLYRLSDDLGDGVWARFQVEHRSRYGDTLKKADEPQPVSADSFAASYPEAYRADEPDTLSEADFIPDRLARLVREALEGGLITVSRAADIMRIDTDSMRRIALSWVDGE